MLEEEIIAFWGEVKRCRATYPEWREGQTLMNVLRNWPELYDMVSGTDADCFYQDKRIHQFRETLGI